MRAATATLRPTIARLRSPKLKMKRPNASPRLLPGGALAADPQRGYRRRGHRAGVRGQDFHCWPRDSYGCNCRLGRPYRDGSGALGAFHVACPRRGPGFAELGYNAGSEGWPCSLSLDLPMGSAAAIPWRV